MNTIQYKGYVGKFAYEQDDDIFHGRVINIQDMVTFAGKSIEELKSALKGSVDEYLAFCVEKGRAPEKPFSGKFNVRVEPDLHRAIATAAITTGKSMNKWIVDALESAANAPSDS